MFIRHWIIFRQNSYSCVYVFSLHGYTEPNKPYVNLDGTQPFKHVNAKIEVKFSWYVNVNI